MALTKTAVDNAIETILTTGQSVTLDGMTYTAASIKSLMDISEKMRLREMSSTRPMVRGIQLSAMGY